MSEARDATFEEFAGQDFSEGTVVFYGTAVHGIKFEYFRSGIADVTRRPNRVEITRMMGPMHDHKTATAYEEDVFVERDGVFFVFEGTPEEAFLKYALVPKGVELSKQRDVFV